MRMDLLVNEFVYKALTDKYITIFEKNFVRNYIHIRDVAYAFNFVKENYDRLSGNTFNVGLSDANLSKQQLVEKIQKYVPDFAITYSDYYEDPDKRDYIVSNKKIEKEGWRPQYSLDDGIKDYRVDIRDREKIIEITKKERPDFIFHLAAQSLVRESYLNPVDTWSTNLMGTLNILEALRKVDKKCTAVIITSDKCYDNVEWVWGYKETDSLGGPDPYSSSKGAAELLIKSYLKSFFASET